MRPDAYYVQDSGELTCPKCLKEDLYGYCLKANRFARLRPSVHSSERTALAAMRLAEAHERDWKADDIAEILSGTWPYPYTGYSPKLRNRGVSDWFKGLYRPIYDWEMDSREGDYCGCGEELSAPWVECHNCECEGTPEWVVTDDPAGQPYWPGDGTGAHVIVCRRCESDVEHLSGDARQAIGSHWKDQWEWWTTPDGRRKAGYPNFAQVLKQCGVSHG